MASFTDPPREDLRPFAATDLVVASAQAMRRVDIRYVAGAVVSLPLAAIAFARFGASGRFVVAGVLLVVLCVLAAIDIAERRLPNRIVLPALAFVLPAQIAIAPDRAPEWILASVGAAAVLLLPLLVRPDGVGMGDVKLALLLGAALGAAVTTALVVASVAAAAYAAVLLVRGGQAARTATMPLGPFLAFGGIVTLLAVVP